MYTPKDKFEAVRYGQMYGANPNATKRDMRRNGRQFRRYLRTDVADRDRAAFEQAEQQRRNDEMAMTDAMLASKLYGSMNRSMKVNTEDAIARMNDSRDSLDRRTAELAEQDLTNRIANANRFSDAFRTARQAGLDEFTWKGKRYGTRLASEMPGYTPPTNTNTDTKTKTNTNTSNDTVTNTNTNTSKGTVTSADTSNDTVTNTNGTTTAQTGGGWREVTPAGPANGWTTATFQSHPNFRKIHGSSMKNITINGKTYPVAVTTGAFSIPDIANDHMYAFNPETGMIRKISESWLFGGARIPMPWEDQQGPQFERGSTWIDPAKIFGSPKVTTPSSGDNRTIGGGITYRRFGGPLHRINYFQ